VKRVYVPVDNRAKVKYYGDEDAESVNLAPLKWDISQKNRRDQPRNESERNQTNAASSKPSASETQNEVGGRESKLPSQRNSSSDANSTQSKRTPNAANDEVAASGERPLDAPPDSDAAVAAVARREAAIAARSVAVT